MPGFIGEAYVAPVGLAFPNLTQDPAPGGEPLVYVDSANRLAYHNGRAKTILGSLTGPDVASVKDFGAVGDGVTNDLQAFRDAIASGTATVYVPPGDYVIDEAGSGEMLRLLPGQSMHGLYEGRGPFSTFKCALRTSSNRPILSPGNFSSIKNLQFIGSGKAAGLLQQTGIILNSASGHTSQGCIVQNCVFWRLSGGDNDLEGGGIYGRDIATSRSIGCAITDCIFYDCNAGLNLRSRTEYSHVYGCKFIFCNHGVVIDSGNITLSTFDIQDCTVGLKLEADGANAGNTSILQGIIAHNTTLIEVERFYNKSSGAHRLARFTNCVIGVGALLVNGSAGISFNNCNLTFVNLTLSNDGTKASHVIVNGGTVLDAGAGFGNITVDATSTLAIANAYFPVSPTPRAMNTAGVAGTLALSNNYDVDLS